MANVDYTLGHGDREVRRLELQASMLGPGTEQALVSAGLRRGMSVLDIGTGAGDVAMLAARIVGPTGSVLGIDREPSVLQRARARALADGLNAGFEPATLETLSAARKFDMVVGRYLLCWQADRVAYLKRAASFVRPGGTLLFMEPTSPEPEMWDTPIEGRWSEPPVALFEDAIRLFFVAAKLSGAHAGTGTQLVKLFHEAGLAEPALLQNAPVGGPGSSIIEWLCLTVESMLPLLEKRGVTTRDRIGIDTLSGRMREAAREARSQLRFSALVCGWVKIAAPAS